MIPDSAPRHAPGFATLAVHAGAGAVGGPWAGIPGLGEVGAAAAALEERVAALEGGTAALAVASGEAALGIALAVLLDGGGEVVVGGGLHAGTAPCALARLGPAVRWAEGTAPADVEILVTERTRAILVPSLSGDGEGTADAEALAAVARRARVPLLVDNALATPYLLRPLEAGADAVLHLGVGFLGGAGAAGGLIVDGGRFCWEDDPRFPALSRPRPELGGATFGEICGNFAFAAACRAALLGDPAAILSPEAAAAVLAGMETLALRMRRQCDGALAVATRLSGHAAVARVSYPGLSGAFRRALAGRWGAGGGGALLSFTPESGPAAAERIEGRLRLFAPGTAPGGARSLVLPRGPGGTLRLSVGVEEPADLVADLEAALDGLEA